MMRIEKHCEIKSTPEFDKELKKLRKKYKTLNDDLEIFLNTQIYLYHIKNIDNKGVFNLSNIGIAEPKTYKAKKFSCRSLSGTGSRSGIRVIYSYQKRKNKKDKIILIEIYYKGDKKNEDRDRIKKYFKSNR